MTKEEFDAREAERDRLDPDRILRHKAFAMAIKELFLTYIYVTPRLFKALLRLNINISGQLINKDKDFCIYTKNYHVPAHGPFEFWVKPKFGKAIATLVEDSPQFMFPKNQKFIKYNKNEAILYIKGIGIALSKAGWKKEFCDLIFEDQKSKFKSIPFLLLTYKLSSLKNTDTSAESALRKRIARFNKEIYDNTGIDEFWEIRDNAVGINTLYL
jgi:hypothetical protein